VLRRIYNFAKSKFLFLGISQSSHFTNKKFINYEQDVPIFPCFHLARIFEVRFISSISPLIDMNISVELTPELVEYIESKVSSGKYKSRSEVVREAIRMMIKSDLERMLEEKGFDLKKFRGCEGKDLG